ncbi:MAG: hypothetical protein AMJ81_02195 [Phycisphaerae bacterium SM23_33]|nr:MAG: hypothetical protein AMJ81_02195 [Phycisphaerae bacterium SM23_33]
MTGVNAETEAVFAELARIAEIAAGILDGEEVKRIIAEQAMHYVANPDPEHRYLSGDYFDADHELFLRTKKLLTRLERLGKVPLNGSVWVPIPGREEVTVAVQNGAYHRYYQFGQERLATPPEMKQVFANGQVLRVAPAEGDRLATVLAPVRDSLGDVVAVAEFTAPLDAPPPAWS